MSLCLLNALKQSVQILLTDKSMRWYLETNFKDFQSQRWQEREGHSCGLEILLRFIFQFGTFFTMDSFELLWLRNIFWKDLNHSIKFKIKIFPNLFLHSRPHWLIIFFIFKHNNNRVSLADLASTNPSGNLSNYNDIFNNLKNSTATLHDVL